MTAYLLTAAGVIFLTVLVSFIIPDGKLNKSVNFILRMVCIGVLLKPVMGFFSFPADEDKELADYTYVCKIYADTQSQALEEDLNKNFGLDCACEVDVSYFDGEIRENGVAVFIEDCDSAKLDSIWEYLKSLGYINITVNEKGG